jgi:hypothetical protein
VDRTRFELATSAMRIPPGLSTEKLKSHGISGAFYTTKLFSQGVASDCLELRKNAVLSGPKR